MNDVLTIVLSCIGTVLTALITWATQRLVVYINTKTNNVKAQEYLLKAGDVVTNVVKHTYQTYVDAIKKNGMWAAESQKTALNMALDTAKAMLSQEIKDFLANSYGSLDSWLETRIESRIYDMKAAENS